jgi:hypothetical protein
MMLSEIISQSLGTPALEGRGIEVRVFRSIFYPILPISLGGRKELLSSCYGA